MCIRDSTYYKVDYTDRILGIAASLANEAQYRQFITRNPSLAVGQALLDFRVPVSTPHPAQTIGGAIDGRRQKIRTPKPERTELART